jgi:hypothetical protein
MVRPSGTLNAMTPLKTLEKEVARLPKREREHAEERISAFGTALLKDSETVSPVVDLVKGERLPEDEEASLAELETRNLKRVLALWRRVLAESLPATELTQLGLRRQQLKQLRDQGRLVGLQPPLRTGFVYPAWQFDPQTGHPFASLPKVIEAAEEAKLDALDLHLLMTSAAAENGTAPSEWFASGDLSYVLDLVRGSSDIGS